MIPETIIVFSIQLLLSILDIVATDREKGDRDG